MSFSKCTLFAVLGILFFELQFPKQFASANKDQPSADAVTVAVAGMCNDDQGRAVTEAVVKLYRSTGPLSPMQLVHEVGVDDDGHFKMPSVTMENDEHGNTQYEVVATATGHASLTLRLTDRVKSDALSLNLHSKPGTLVGVVMGPDGKPVKDARVYLPRIGSFAVIDGVASATTDAAGKFRIADLVPWKQDAPASRRRNLLIAHPEFARTSTMFTSIPQVIRVQLSEPAIVQGRVLDKVTDKPVPNVVVSAQGIAASRWHQTRTDKNGNYELLMTPDRYNIWAEMDDRMPIAASSIKATAGKTETGADIQLVTGTIIYGSIVDPSADDGVPIIGNLRVGHYGPARPRSSAAVTSAQVKADGSYRIHVAPGENYIYLMSGNASALVQVDDGKEIEVNLIAGQRQDLRKVKTVDTTQRKRQIASQELAAWRAAKDGDKDAKPASRVRGKTKVGKLLDLLEQRNSGPLRFNEPWLQTLKDIVDVGPDAVAELIEELDQTDDNLMMRCMGFTLRAINDKRAIPALIRAIPKTLLPPGSDMGLCATTPALLEFAQKHDLDKGDPRDGGRYGLGRPVREICGALQTLSDHDFDNADLFHTFLAGTDAQQERKRILFQRKAEQWATWWESNAEQMGVGAAYQLVNLPEEEEKPLMAVELGVLYQTDSGGSNWILETAQAPNSGRVFYDVDTGRAGKLPERWKKLLPGKLPMDEIIEWARSEGFDMMGTEVEINDGETRYGLRLIGMRAMQLPMNRWDMKSKGIMLEDLIAEASPIGEYLFHHKDGKIDYLAHAPFFVVTAEETPALLFLGIEVRDDSLKPGGVFSGDNELNPIAFRKGRRFAFKLFKRAD